MKNKHRKVWKVIFQKLVFEKQTQNRFGTEIRDLKWEKAIQFPAWFDDMSILKDTRQQVKKKESIYNDNTIPADSSSLISVKTQN